MAIHRDITVKQLWSAATVAAGTTLTSASIDLGGLAQSGFFSVHYTITGAGTVAMSCKLSNDGTNFVDSTDGYKIKTGQTVTSGHAADGKDLVSFAPSPVARMKVCVFETGGVSAAVVTVWLAMQ